MQQLDDVREKWLAAAAAAASLEELEQVRIEALGKKGEISRLMKALGGLGAEERREAGQRLNALKEAVGLAIETRKRSLGEAALDARLAAERVDVTLPPRPEPEGRIHPVSQTIDEIVAIFGEMGFSVAEGPDIEDDFHNFTALNIPPAHPARQMHDTFYLSERVDGAPLVLRTHTSPVQVRHMQKHPPPIRIIVPGRVYRRDNADATHNPTFQQIEGLYVDKHVTVGDLKGTVEFVFKELLGEEVKLRFRPHYFSYTEPSFEIDFSSPMVRKMGKRWLELAGCGMVHPQVFKNVGYDPELWSGWAFGFGIERIAMLRYEINDIRLFYENDTRFLKQF